jgi:thiol:disulfide interchange protein/DsbC/DsbD-like thiol-disulfide interchange protein
LHATEKPLPVNLKPILLVGALALLLAPTVHAAAVRGEHIEAELVAERTAFLPGATNWVALRLKPEPGWHTYWLNPGDSGIATTVQWTVMPQGWKAGDIAWPYPSTQRYQDLVNYGYGEETLHLVPLEVPRAREDRATVQAAVKWLVCADICIPGTADLALSLPVSEIATADPVWSPRFEETRRRIPGPEPLAGTFAFSEDEMRLLVASSAFADASKVEFFPLANDLVNHGAPQRVALEGEHARFAQARSAYFGGMPRALDGVLVVHGGDVRAYRVTAAPGEVATVAASPAPAIASGEPAVPAQAPSLALVLGFALLGGLILNLMPCVFPVLSIKAVSVLESRRGDAAGERAHALAYTAGVVASCIAVAIALVALRGGGELIGWGFQLQSPVFVAFLAYLMLALGLSLSGVVQLGTSLMGVGQSLAEKGGYAGSFFTGVLAVVVASPCTAPYMGTALGYALAQPAPIAILVFAVLGLGLSLPFLLLGFVPALAAWLPRPGAWMETFKQFMAFPLYLTVVWLLWVLGRQAGVDAVALALLGLTLVAFATWLWSSATRGAIRTALAFVSAASAVGLLASPLMNTPRPRGTQGAPSVASAPTPVAPTAAAGLAAMPGSEPYSEERLAALRAAKKPVFVNFTADWCITCKVNEKVVFSRDDVRTALADAGVVWLTADWTNPDPVITAALARFGRSGVPLYVLYPADGDPAVLPQILTPDTFIEAVRKSRPKEE